ncbi:MAG: hypothetical protein KZQ80_14990 [Candidatus Thiodiazotropha sp. (ex Monitilora ramsayi)]|nr:hypothetical protein [Candidatus Thiodiazotropha sp. (ex Monitilora ramsayi)]
MTPRQSLQLQGVPTAQVHHA